MRQSEHAEAGPQFAFAYACDGNFSIQQAHQRRAKISGSPKQLRLAGNRHSGPIHAKGGRIFLTIYWSVEDCCHMPEDRLRSQLTFLKKTLDRLREVGPKYATSTRVLAQEKRKEV